MTSHPSWILQKDTAQSRAVILHDLCESSVDLHFVNSNTRTSREDGKDCSKKGQKSVSGTIAGVGGKASHLWAVVKPPEEGQCSGVTRPDHRSQINLLPPDGYDRSGEIYTLHWTWGSNTYTTAQSIRTFITHVCIQINAETRKTHTNSWNTKYDCDHSRCTFSSRCVFFHFPRLKCRKVIQPWLKWNSAEWGTWLSMKETRFMLYALPQEWVMMFLIHILVMCKNSVLLSDPWLFSAEAVTR